MAVHDSAEITTSAIRLSGTLRALGYAEASPERLEWMYSYPSAQPFLGCLEHFSPHCALTASELARNSRLQQRQGQPDDTIINRAYHALQTLKQVPSPSDNDKLAATSAAAERVRLLRKHKEMLEKSLQDVRETRSEHSSKLPSISTALLKVRAAALRFQSLQKLLPSTLHIDLLREYLRAELRLQRETVNAVHSLWNMPADENEMPDNYESSRKDVSRLIAQYGELLYRNAVDEVRLARAASVITSLQVDDDGDCSNMDASVDPIQQSVCRVEAHWKSLLEGRLRSVLAQSAESALGSDVKTAFAKRRLERQRNLLRLASTATDLMIEQRLRLAVFAQAIASTGSVLDMLQEYLSAIVSQSESSVSEEEKLGLLDEACRVSKNEHRAVENELCELFEDTLRSITEGDHEKVDSGVGHTQHANSLAGKGLHVNDDSFSALEQQKQAKRYSSLLHRVNVRIGRLREHLANNAGESPSSQAFATAHLLNQVQEAVAQNGAALEALLKDREARCMACSSGSVSVPGDATRRG